MMPTTFTIDDVLQEVLDKIVDSDPQYNNRSQLIRAWIWEKVQNLGYYEGPKIEKAAQAEVN